MNNKPRVLVCGEAHYASAGFAKMTREFCSKLHNAGYPTAELANAGHTDQVDRNFCKWHFYGVLPDKFEEQEFNSNAQNIWGFYRLEETILDFRPDYIFTFLDHWNCTHIFNSPLRRFFKLGFLSCIDSEPVKLDWLNQIESADDVYGYTDWALDVANQQSNAINDRGFMAPGADFSVYKPHPDRKKHREQSGIDPNWLIAGMVARNQKRKLFPDLFAGFRLFLDKYGKSHKELTDRAKLYIHTSMPDAGYDIPYLIKEYGLCNRILTTYICRQCKHPFVSHFRDVRTSCIYCKSPAAFMPRVEFGVAENVLSDIINLFDVYLQVCTNEGLGIPQLEAGACSIPVMSTDYSATSDVVKKLNGYPLKVASLFKEVETQGYKAVPDNESMADRLFEFFSLPELERKKKGLQTRLATLKYFNYDKAIKRLMENIDKVDLDPNRWNEPPQVVQIPTAIPNFNSIYDLTSWCIINILGRPELINHMFHKRLVHDLNRVYRHNGSGTNLYFNENTVYNPRDMISNFTIEQMVNELSSLRQSWNSWELRRTGQIQVPRKPYLDRAKPQ
jgi:glycosyltransferase involved in cell wall biosynthesis